MAAVFSVWLLGFAAYYLGWIAPGQAEDAYEAGLFDFPGADFILECVWLCGQHKVWVCVTMACLIFPGLFLRQFGHAYYLVLNAGVGAVLLLAFFHLGAPFEVIIDRIRDAMPEERDMLGGDEPWWEDF